jgi:DNA-binding CsgD family transcriptional regulator
MRAGYQSLTEKEKQTLRLLVSGFDAKSMARHLGLSVHTVNERLRDARRKMATSSSREAARLLHEVEAQCPEIMGDKTLGDAPAPGAAQMTLQPAQGDGMLRRTGWIVGGPVMTITVALLALSALSGPSQAPAVTEPASVATAPAVAATPASEAAAVDAARQFLALLDRDDWAASWQAAHPSFKLLNTVEWWADASKQVRGAMGTASSRELATVNFVAAPPNGYWIIAFKANYSKKGAAVETLHLASENGGWRMTGISVE